MMPRLFTSGWEGRLVIGAVGWIAALLVVGGIVIVRGDQFEDRWRLVLLAFLGAPFALGLLAQASHRGAVRAAVMGGAFVPAGVATMFSYLTALPAFLMLVGALAIAVSQMSRERGVSAPAGLLGVAIALALTALWGAGFLALFASEDERCATFSDGSGCTSDVVTALEAGTGLGLLLTAFVLAFALVRIEAARSEAAAV